MSVSVAAEAVELEMTGREVLDAGGHLTRVSRAEDGLLFTSLDPGHAVPADQLVPLPLPGEFVRTTTAADGALKGFWLGKVDEYGSFDDGTLAVFILDGVVRQVRLTADELDARKIVFGEASGGEFAFTALLTEARAHQATRATHSAWVDQLVQAAHQEADDQGWCSQFDDFMANNGLPRRTRDYELRVDVTATIWLTRSGTDSEDAINQLNTADVWQSLTQSDIEWTAEES